MQELLAHSELLCCSDHASRSMNCSYGTAGDNGAADRPGASLYVRQTARFGILDDGGKLLRFPPAV
jgi:hypothetical protein